MIDALIAGKIHGQPSSRTGQSGKTFTVAKIKAQQGDGEQVFVSTIAFDDKAAKALLATRNRSKNESVRRGKRVIAPQTVIDAPLGGAESWGYSSSRHPRRTTLQHYSNGSEQLLM